MLHLFVASGLAEHDLVVEMHRHVFDRLEPEPRRLGLLHQPPQVRLFPTRLARKQRRVHLDAAGPDLRGKAQLLLGQLVELADRDPDCHFAAPYPLTDPAVSPCTMKRCAAKNSSISGAEDSTAPAISGPQGRVSLVMR